MTPEALLAELGRTNRQARERLGAALCASTRRPAEQIQETASAPRHRAGAGLLG